MKTHSRSSIARSAAGVLFWWSLALPARAPAADQPAAPKPKSTLSVEGEVIDVTTRRAIPARLYVRSDDGAWHFARSASASGSAIRYDRQRPNTESIERHTTLSAHPFRLELPPGRYTFTVERGKEYLPETRVVAVHANISQLSFALRRWVNMAEAGWYSGDTHVHRPPAELANVMLAEDVNVALPLMDWTTQSQVPPTADPRSLGGSLGNDVVAVDATHAWSARNTEYEIFRTNNREHRLGAFFVLNHRTRFDRPLFPIRDVIKQAREEGALIDLEKHNWPWTIAMVPVLKADVIELANNHHWQTEYAVKNWAVPAPAWMKLAGTGTDTERDWTHYGLHTYYALLNSGFRLAPTAGSANGVHPVPLGFSRVYVVLDEPFRYDAWIRGLAAGHSFVTTGPMLRAKVDGRWPGARFAAGTKPARHHLQCEIRSEQPLESIELIVNGEIAHRFEPANTPEAGAFSSQVGTHYQPEGTSWLAWRCFEKRPGGRMRFAHTGPWYFDVAGAPLRPRRVVAEWLVDRVKDEIARSRDIVPREFLAEYERALALYEGLAATAHP
jgi:hypothetical protein